MATVNLTLGAAGDYTSLTAFAAAINGGTVTGATTGDDLILTEVDGAAYDEGFLPTANGGSYGSITLTVAEGARHNGTPGAGARIAISTAIRRAIYPTFTISLTVDWWEITAVGSGSISSAINSYVVEQAGVLLRVSNCLIHSNGTWSGAGNLSGGILPSRDACEIVNTAIWDWSDADSSCQGIRVSSSGQRRLIYNCTVDRISSGTADAAGIFLADNVEVRNTVVTRTTAGTTAVDWELFSDAGRKSHNASSDATALGTVSVTSVDAATAFEDADAGDYRPTAGGVLDGAAIDLSSAGFEVDAVAVDPSGRDRDACGDDWSIGAYQYVDPADHLLIASLHPYEIVRPVGASTADLTVAGSYVRAAAVGSAVVEARYAGGAWETIDAAPAGGFFSGTLSARPRGQGEVEVRFSDATGVVGSVPHVGVSNYRFAVYGQSNARSRGTNPRAYSHASLKASQYSVYGWAELVDIAGSNAKALEDVMSEGNAAGGHWAHQLATDAMGETGLPVGFVIGGRGAQSITSLLPGADRRDRTTLYGAMVDACLRSGGVDGVLWWQGEQDVIDQMPQSTYNGHLDTLADALAEDLGCKLMPCRLQNSTSLSDVDEAAIRAAVDEAVADNPNVVAGPDFSAIDSDDGYHFTTDIKVDNAGALWWDAADAGFATASLSLTGPTLHAGYSLTVGTAYSITATVDGASGEYELTLYDGDPAGAGTLLATIAEGASLPYSWTPTASHVGSGLYLRAADAADETVFDDLGPLTVATTEAGTTLDPSDAPDIRDGVTLGGVEGTLIAAAAATTAVGTTADDGEGAFVGADPDTTLLGEPANGGTGNVRLPPTTKVEADYDYGAADALAGELVPESESLAAIRTRVELSGAVELIGAGPAQQLAYRTPDRTLYSTVACLDSEGSPGTYAQASNGGSFGPEVIQ